MAFIPGSDLSEAELTALGNIRQPKTGEPPAGHSIVESLIHKGYLSRGAEGLALTPKGLRVGARRHA